MHWSKKHVLQIILTVRQLKMSVTLKIPCSPGVIYLVKFMVVLTQPTVVLVQVPAAGDLTPQGEEENTQAHQTENHGPAGGSRKGWVKNT